MASESFQDERGAPAQVDPLVGLMVDYQRGQIEAFEGLYAALAGDLLRHFKAVSRDGFAQDLVQDTFLELHRSRHTYLAPLPVRPWVFGVARNVLRRHRRTVARRARREDAAVVEGAVLEATSVTVRRAAVDGSDVDEALSSLGASRRRLWEMHHLQGFSFHEISRHLGIPVAAAKLRSSRTMRTLRAILGIEKGGHRG
jgi:RNA polymerase sigma-70 factor (ECF subfamily)